MSGTKKARVFVPLMKVDEEQRLVFGKITAQEVDQSGEMMDYETSKPNFESWSSQIETASGGLSKGNLRVMHGLSVAGKLTDIAFNDADQSIEVCAKVVDDTEWNKVLEGCYTGFSVGGKYGKKWKETVDGETITKFTAVPNEVSIVDNPCVKSATFALVKADGAEEQIAFQVEDLAKKNYTAAQRKEMAKNGEAMSDGSFPIANKKDLENAIHDYGRASDQAAAKAWITKRAKALDATDLLPADWSGSTAEKAASAEDLQKDHRVPEAGEPSATAIAEKAGELAKAANDGSTWQDHIAAAREDLMKTTALQLAAEQAREAGENAGTGEAKEETEEAESERGSGDTSANEGTDDTGTGEASEKVTPPGLMQKWECSDGKTFEKKADAVAHEEELQKVASPKTEAEKLRERLAKATTAPESVEAEPGVMEDFDRLSKVVAALSTPFENGEPKLEKGMYTVNRFSSVLSDMASLSKSIKAEGQREGNDQNDSTVAQDVIDAVKSLGKSFLSYAADQVTELLAGMDDEVIVGYYDYYYNAAQVDPENGLAKDVCSVVNDLRDPSREQRDTLAKAFGGPEEDEDHDDGEELSPPMQKRFDSLTAENEELKKVANEAVEKVEELTKRVQTIEDTPLPRAPRNVNVALRPGDGTFFGKTATTEEEKLAVVHDMLKTEGPDAVALKLIKLAQQNPQHLQLKS